VNYSKRPEGEHPRCLSIEKKSSNALNFLAFSAGQKNNDTRLAGVAAMDIMLTTFWKDARQAIGSTVMKVLNLREENGDRKNKIARRR
jgi:hypothetical protein